MNQPKPSPLLNKDNQVINKVGYPVLQNRPVSCPTCANTVRGVVTEQQDPLSREVFRIIMWRCGKCNTLIKRGAAA